MKYVCYLISELEARQLIMHCGGRSGLVNFVI